MSRTTSNVGKPGFILGVNYDANDGRQVDFSRVPTSFENADGNKELPGGTVVSELGSGKVVPRSSTKAAITNLTEDGTGTATATAADHGYEVGDEIKITGAGVDAYNGTWTIATVPDADTFTFDGVSGSPADDGSGATAVIVAMGILLATALQGDTQDAISGYGLVIGGVVFKNLLEEDGNSDFDTWLSELKENGTGFVFESYSDDRSN
ncbi:hypothetical protein [Fodinibius sp.]|uniref:hypothetical protein n=1 Tax=Fodinibius sp. TaxID=1872440 RepID=UPI002ACEF77F|nr:hypothetical protein [Fodinibius sp.]MDZ7658073.1 hypothetical protein [Fodinibius sp.]